MKIIFSFLAISLTSIFVNAADTTKADQVMPAVGDKEMAHEVQIKKLDEKKTNTILSRISVNALAESYANMTGMANGDGNAETDYSGAVTYKVTDKSSVRVYSEWDHKWGLNSGKKRSNIEYTDFQDPYVGYTRTGVIETASGFRMDTQARIYAPLGVDSVVANQVAQIRAYAVFSQPLGRKWTASLQISPRYFIQNQDTYVEPHSQVTYGTDKFRMEDFLGLKYDFNDKFAAEQTLGVYNMWFNADTTKTAVGTREDFLMASTSLIYSPSRAVFLKGGIRQSKYSTNLRDSGNAGNQNGIYSPDQSEYYFIASFTL